MCTIIRAGALVVAALCSTTAPAVSLVDGKAASPSQAALVMRGDALTFGAPHKIPLAELDPALGLPRHLSVVQLRDPVVRAGLVGTTLEVQAQPAAGEREASLLLIDRTTQERWRVELLFVGANEAGSR